MRFSGRLRTLAFGLVALLWASTAGADEMRSKLGKKMDEVGLAELLKERGASSVAVGEFTLPARLNASGGPSIADALIDVLAERGLKADRKARFELTGRVTRGKVGGLSCLKIRVMVEDTDGGGTLLEFDASIVDAATIMQVAGGSGDISGKNRQEQSDKLDRALDDPKVDVKSRPGAGSANTRIAAEAGSPYAIEFLVKDGRDYRPRAAADLDGQAAVRLGKGDVYAVHLINDSDRAAAVSLTVDGMSVFTFSDDPGHRNSRLIVPPRETVRVIGWFRNLDRDGSNEFLVTDRAGPLVEKQVPTGSPRIGTVTATFAVAWPRGEAPPPGEVEETDPDLRDDLRTGIGQPVDQPIKLVNFTWGKPKVAISVRYNKVVEPGDLPRDPGR